MATIKTTLKVESNALSFPVNYSATISNVLTASNYGRVTLTDDAPSDISDMKFGTEGGYIYVQSSIANTLGTVITIWIKGESGQPGTQLASLKPGESLLLPLAATQNGTYATTNLGKTAILDYYVGDKGGKWGKSMLILLTGGTNWEYIIADTGLGQVSNRIDTGLPIDTWSQNDIDIVQEKGYILSFYEDGGYVGSSSVYIFVNSRGEMIPNDISSEPGYFGMIGYKVTTKIQGTELIVFDGDNLFTHNFNGASSVNIETYDATADGSFVIKASDYNGVTSENGADSMYLISGAQKFKLSTINHQATNFLYATAYLREFSNFIFVRTYQNYIGSPTSPDVRYQIFDTSGILLQDLNVDGYGIDNIDVYFYGDNRMQIMALSNTYLYMFNYNHELDRFIGKDFEWKENPENFGSSYQLMYENKSVYGWSDTHEYNGIAIQFHTQIDSVNSDNALWVKTDDLKIYYLLDGMSTFSTYTIDQPIWFNPDSSKFNQITSTSLFMDWSTQSNAGIYKTLVLNATPYNVQSININSLTVFNDYSVIYPAIWGIETYPAGNDYKFLHAWNNDETTMYAVAITKGLVRTLTQTGVDYWDWDTAWNTYKLEINYNNDALNTTYYFNFKQNQFVNLNKMYSSTYYFPDNYANYNTGEVKTVGNKLLLFESSDPLPLSSCRILTESTITTDKPFPASENYNLYTGTNFIIWVYRTTSNGAWIINTYDLAMNLTSSYNTGYPNWYDSWEVGDRFMFKFVAVNGDRQYIWVCSKGSFTSDVNPDDEHTTVVNDANWFDNWC